MTTPLELDLEVHSDASDAVRDLDRVGDAARDMAAQVERASSDAAAAAGKLDRIGEAADGVDEKASAATGALGALSSGFELVGMEKYAAGLQGAAMATDFFSGAGQAANLILSTTRGASIKAAVATRAKAAADRASAIASNLSTAAGRRALITQTAQAAATRAVTVATKAQAIAQRVLNAVLRANPIGLIITAVLALVAGLTLAYKKSDTFRGIVKTLGNAGKAAIGWIVDKISSLVSWVRDKAPAAFRTFRDAVQTIAGKISGFLSPITTLVGGIIDKIGSLVEKAKSIKLPDLNPLNRSSGAVGTTAAATSAAAVPIGGDLVQITVQGALDPDAVARQIGQLLDRRSRRTGGL